MGRITAAALVLAAGKLSFSTAMLAVGSARLGLGPGQLQTFAFVTLVFGSQALLYVLRERRHLWDSRPGIWVLVASAADVSLVCVLASSGVLMAPLSWDVLTAALAAASGFALVLDQIKRPVMSAFGVWRA
jgi:H+-transporting ATPase